MNTQPSLQKPKVGVFDSGIGGFSVLKEIRDVTSVDVLYFGDCARAPYGNRTSEEIQMFMEEIINTLQQQDVTHFVSACNSMSVTMTDTILKDCGVDHTHYMDMLKAFKEYGRFSSDSKVLVIGTRATIVSGAYQEVLNEKNVPVEEYIFKTLAGLIEQGVSEDEVYDVVLVGMMHAKELGVTHIVYGCTHYPLIDTVFRRCAEDIEWNGDFIDPAKYVAEAVSQWNLEGERNTFFEASEVTEPFRTLSEKYAI